MLGSVWINNFNYITASLTNLISFPDKDSHLVDQEKTVDVGYFFYFSKASNTLTVHNMMAEQLIDKSGSKNYSK